MTARVVNRDAASGRASWVHRDGDLYLVTGRDRSGRRFTRSFTSWSWADSLNAWSASWWLVRDGRRHLIRRCTN